MVPVRSLITFPSDGFEEKSQETNKGLYALSARQTRRISTITVKGCIFDRIHTCPIVPPWHRLHQESRVTKMMVIPVMVSVSISTGTATLIRWGRPAAAPAAADLGPSADPAKHGGVQAA